MLLCGMGRRRVAIIGGGPAGLMAADTLASACDVHLYEHGRALGRKFLVAGQGGFNLTNSAEGGDLLARYRPAGFLDEALLAFGPAELRAWLAERGIPTFTGTSGRVFPERGIKPITVLERIRTRLVEQGVRIHLEHVFDGFDEAGRLIIEHRAGRSAIEADHVVFALGGASWPVTGSTGIWPPLFAPLGIRARPFRPSNCGIAIPWPAVMAQAHAGKPLKNLRVTAGDMTALGEATITAHGLEGNAIYPVVPAVREALSVGKEAVVRLDLKPTSPPATLLHKLSGASPKAFAKALHLDRAQLALLKAFTPKERFLDAAAFVADVKDLRLPVSALRPVGEAISVVGGIALDDLAADFSFKRHPRLFAVGEMVDWDAPTGGFLLQGCFAMGRHAAHAILARPGPSRGQ